MKLRLTQSMGPHKNKSKNSQKMKWRTWVDVGPGIHWPKANNSMKSDDDIQLSFSMNIFWNSAMWACTYVHICIHIRIYMIRKKTQAHIWIKMCMYIHIYIYIYACVCIYMYIYVDGKVDRNIIKIFLHIDVYVCVYIYVCMYR